MKRIKFLILPLFLLAACGGKETNDTAAKIAELKKERQKIDAELRKLEANVEDTGRKSTPVSVIAVSHNPFQAFVEVQASITGDENVFAVPQTSIPASVTAILVRPGQKVSRGQVLATLDASSISQSIASTDAQITLLKSLYEKQQRLWAQQIGTEVQLLTAKAQYDAAMKGRSAQSAQAGQFRILSPINGTVDEVNLQIGDVVSAASGMTGKGIRVVNSTKLKAEANLGESYVGKVNAGDPVVLLFPEVGDSIRTKVTYVAQSVDPVSRAFRVEVSLGSNNKLRPNMSANMKIANYERSEAITVPVSVIQKTAEGDMVFVAQKQAGKKDAVAKSVQVKTGRVSMGQIEILGGLSDGDLVITEGFQNLDDGAPVVTTP